MHVIRRYASSESLEGGFPQASLPFHTSVMKRCLDDPVNLRNLSAEDMGVVRRVFDVMKDATKIAMDSLYDKDEPEVRALLLWHWWR